eukprot:14725581-Alexandrium_andersonii.AAC.1
MLLSEKPLCPLPTLLHHAEDDSVKKRPSCRTCGSAALRAQWRAVSAVTSRPPRCGKHSAKAPSEEAACAQTGVGRGCSRALVNIDHKLKVCGR